MKNDVSAWTSDLIGLQQYPRKVCIIPQLCFSKLQTMLLTSFEDSFFLDLIEEVWSKIHNLQSKVNDE